MPRVYPPPRPPFGISRKSTRVPVGTSSGESIFPLFDFTIRWAVITDGFSHVSGAVAEAVKQLCSPGGVNEYLKVLGVVGLSGLTCPCTVSTMWTLWAVPVE